jgi:LPXTG-motif cell wall-anchored protein
MRAFGNISRFVIALTLSLVVFFLYDSSPLALGQWASIDIESAPSSLKPGERVKITWEVEGEGKISHTAVHWDTKAGTPGNFRSYGRLTPDFASINPPQEAPQEYRISFDAPSSGTIYYIVHAVVDGKDYYNLWERTIPIERASEGEAAPSTEGISPISYGVVGVGLVLVVIAGVLFTRRKKA